MSPASKPKAAAPAPTRFHALSDAQLADEIGAIDGEMDAAKTRQDEARAEMTARGKWAIEGRLFTVQKSVCATSSIDTAAVRAEMGEAWVAAHSKPGKRTNFKVGRKDAPAPARKPRSRHAATTQAEAA